MPGGAMRPMIPWRAVAPAIALVAALLAGVPSGGRAARPHGLQHAAAPTATAPVFDVAAPTATVASPTTPGPQSSPTSGLSPSSTPVVASTPVPVSTPLPSATPRPPSFGSLDHAVLFDNGAQLGMLVPGTAKPVGLSFLSARSYRRPRFSGGWQYVYYNNGFWLGDIFGHQQQTAAPVVGGEQVYDAMVSPDGQYIAWQLVTPGLVDGNMVSTGGAGRVAVTDATGGNARTILTQTAGSIYGDVPLLYGWRPGHPPTLLVQTVYARATLLGLHKGLQEYDPVVGDMVNDYLPPLDEGVIPTGEVLGVSPSGATIAYATADALLPSGEGPFPVNLLVTSTGGRRSTLVDTAASHRDRAGKRLPAPRAYIFARQAYIAPDDSRIAYTRLDILYPRGAARPYVRPVACLANLDGSSKVDFGPDERVMGWEDGHTVVVRRENSHVNGLYTVDLTTGATRRILLGSGLQVDGIVP